MAFLKHRCVAYLGIKFIHQKQKEGFKKKLIKEADNPNDQVKHWVLRHRLISACGLLILLLIVVALITF